MNAPSEFKKELQQMLTHYLAHLIKYEKKGNFKIEEFEVRFKPYGKKSFDKTDYYKVVSRLKSCSFNSINSNGENLMRIYNENTNIRAEISGADTIQDYCKNEDINKIIETRANKIKFTLKSSAKTEDEQPIFKIENRDFNFNVSFNLETDYHPRTQNDKIKDIMTNWNISSKTFRLINRVRFESDTSPIAIDLSILRTSKITKDGKYKFEDTINKSGIFSNPEVCEIELEIINSRVGIGTDYSTVDKLIGELQRVIKIVLGGLQSTKYPIPYSEQNNILDMYSQLIHREQRPITSYDFIGPNSYTMQLENVINDPNSTNPNIRKNYCVTDKADGERKLMYISRDGRIYLIDTNMRVQFTGSKVDRDFGNTLLDGEHIQYDKNKKYINLYAAFDIYFVKGESVRELNFWSIKDLEVKSKKNKSEFENRYAAMTIVISNINKTLKSVVQNGVNDIVVNAKTFYFPDETENIFKKCSYLLSKINDGTLIYETDGLIFTPVNTGVGGKEPGQSSEMKKISWPLSLKWKPLKSITNDFLVGYVVDENGKEDIINKFPNGINTTGANQQYRKIALYCGYDNRIRMNPFQDLLDKNIPKIGNSADNENEYKPYLFIPSLPYDPDACFANIPIDEEAGKMITETGETFEKDMIVEFSYDLLSNNWKPLRVRHDKTYSFRIGDKNFGNAYKTANENWKSIHYPVTEEMFFDTRKIPDNSSHDVYYNKMGKDSKNTESLRKFHNYVKNRLIVGVANKDDILIDYAVGKGGDISKWKEANLKFVFGIDVATDNIYNQNDGVCERYLQQRMKNFRMFDAVFLPGNSKFPIRDGSAFSEYKTNQYKLKDITDSIFGAKKINTSLGKMVSDNYEIAKDGFNISSCQFAIHYFFENSEVLHNFLQNVSECTKIGGYFIGTCYDGETVFKKLQAGDYTIYDENKKICDIQKKYRYETFTADNTSLGYAINVFQESINKYATEFLVHFDYFKQLMENYGFGLLEVNKINGLNGSDMFDKLFNQMKKEKGLGYYYKDALNMSEKEKEISFLNRYFIFRKINNVNVKNVRKTNITDVDTVAIPKSPTIPKMFIKKIEDKTVILDKYEPVVKLAQKIDNNVKIAIIIPFRDSEKSKSRTIQLSKFVKYMEDYLQGYSYKIFVIEQSEDGRKFNRGQLLNIGFKAALKEGYDNFVFHDVDLLPSEELKIYYTTIPKQPIHIAAVWRDRYEYEKYFGGIVAFTSEMFQKINGYPNDFWGWGGEDDELYKRVIKYYSIKKTEEGSITDLENLNIEQKLQILRENDLKFDKKKEALERHNATWKTNGINNIHLRDFNIKTKDVSSCGTNCETIHVSLKDDFVAKMITFNDEDYINIDAFMQKK
jgi:hypothetical protein